MTVISLRRWLAANRAMRAWQDRLSPVLSFFSVCSGIEAASVAWNPLGWQCAGVAEIEKFPSAVLAHHYPDVRNHGDFTRIDLAHLPRVDILCGGTPCQAFSVAGARRSLDDARGNLTLAFVDLAHGIKPRNVIWENVPGVLSTKDNAFGCFLAGLVGADSAVIPSAKPDNGKSNRHWKWRKGGRYPVLDDEGEPTGEFVVVEPWHALTWPSHGMVSGPKGRAAWAVKDAQYFGLAQRRKRVILIADFGNGADPAAVLFEPESVRRDSPPSRETGEGVAPTISAHPTGGGGLGTDFDLDTGLRVVSRPLLAKGNDSFDETLQTYVPQIARCDATREGSSQDYESTTMVAVGVTGLISHALKAEGADASEDGTGRGTPIVCVHGTQDPCTSPHTAFALGRNSGGENVIAFSAKDYGADATNNLAPTLRAGGHTSSHANDGVMPAIVHSVAQRSTLPSIKSLLTVFPARTDIFDPLPVRSIFAVQ